MTSPVHCETGAYSAPLQRQVVAVIGDETMITLKPGASPRSRVDVSVGAVMTRR